MNNCNLRKLNIRASNNNDIIQDRKRGEQRVYTNTDFKTKKAFKEAVASGQPVSIYQPNDLFDNPAGKPDYTGSASVEGPHYPKPHTWYAQVTVVNGLVTKVK